MPFCGNDEVLDKPHRPCSEGHSCVRTRGYPPIRRWIEAELTRRYLDLPLGATDASLIAIAERLGIDTIATLDRRHFTVVRPAHVEAWPTTWSTSTTSSYGAPAP